MERKKLFLVSLGHLSNDLNGGALPAVLPYLRSAHNLDYQATGGLMLAYSCLSSLIQPLFGLLADKHNKPWFIPVGILLAGCGMALLGFLGNYWAIFACIAISGIGSAFFHPEGARFVNRVAGAQKGTAMSFFSIGGNGGFILGPLLVTASVGAFGLMGMSIFGLIAVAMAITLAISIARLPAAASPATAPKDAGQFSAEDPAAAEGDALAEASARPEGKNNWREFSKLIVCIISRSIAFTGCNTFIPLYWVSAFGQSKAAGAMALVIFGACGVACNILGGFMSDRYGYVPIIRVAFSLMGPVILIFGLVDNIVFAYAMLPWLGCALYLPFSSQVVLGQSLLAKNIGFASGVTLGLATTLGGVAQPLLGWIADLYGLHTVFYALACMGLTGAFFSYLLKPHSPARP